MLYGRYGAGMATRKRQIQQQFMSSYFCCNKDLIKAMLSICYETSSSTFCQMSGLKEAFEKIKNQTALKLEFQEHASDQPEEQVKFFNISSQMLDKIYIYPQKFPRVQHRISIKLLTNSLPRSGNFISIPLPTYGKTPRFSILPTAMTNKWHFDITVTQFENLEHWDTRLL